MLPVEAAASPGRFQVLENLEDDIHIEENCTWQQIKNANSARHEGDLDINIRTMQAQKQSDSSSSTQI